MKAMSRKKSLPMMRARLALGLLVVGQLWGASCVQAEPSERRHPFVLPSGLPRELPVPQPQGFVSSDTARREADDAHARRTWSVEERRQLRRDIHDAGRDIYGYQPRRD